MERVPELINDLQKDMEQALQLWKQQIQQMETTATKTILRETKAKIKSPSATLVITYLRSSYLTESHHYKIAIYLEEPFVHEPTYDHYFDMAALYNDSAQQMAVFIEKIRSSFIRLLPYEIEEIRRYYMELLYKNSDHFFKRVVQEMISEAQKTPVYFSEEMGNLQMIGVI